MSTCRTIHRAGALALTAVLMLFVGYTTVRTATACTCITLRAENGAVVVGRTMEWAAFDIESEVVADKSERIAPNETNTNNRLTCEERVPKGLEKLVQPKYTETLTISNQTDSKNGNTCTTRH